MCIWQTLLKKTGVLLKQLKEQLSDVQFKIFGNYFDEKYKINIHNIV